MGLIQSVIEKRGIPTVSVTSLREVTEKVRPPRALFVDTPLGYPLVRPSDAAAQSRVLAEALALLVEAAELPVVSDFDLEGA